jgi:hypothetical protein
MRTMISFAISPQEAENTRNLAIIRGFKTVSDYIRHLIREDDAFLISEDELTKRSREATALHAAGNDLRANSIADLLSQSV